MMNWDAVGAIGEILGAIAVFVSLIYLAMQIRTNSKLVMSQNLHASTLQTQEMMSLQATPNVARAIAKTLSDEEVTPEEAVALEAYAVASFIAFYNRFEHQQLGLTNLDWALTRSSIADFLALPWIRLWWEEWGQKRFDKAFVEEVNKLVQLTEGDADYLKRISDKISGQ